MTTLQLLTPEESALRLSRIQRLMADASVPAILVTDNANIYYLTGRVFDGYIYIPAEGAPLYFVRRPVDLGGDGVVRIRKPEQIAESLTLNIPPVVGLELDLLPYTSAQRISAIFPGSEIVNASPVLRAARSVKTEVEIGMIKQSGLRQERVYRMVPRLYRDGMTDLELQVEIERVSRLEGCLGQFRISGDSMELYMGNVLVGDNADNPTPYDFAMGGRGLDPSLPVGADGTMIRRGNSVMVDVNGNYTGYMTDMTRTFSLGEVDALAMRAHRCSIDICERLAAMGTPGAEAKQLYHTAEEMAREAGLERYFMGHAQKAGFVGHGVGIEINEMPVIAPRSRDILAEGNVIALEPKFVIPGVGAVGIENTYVMTSAGMQSLTNAPVEIIQFAQ
ncbi:Xaa-Pro peptidase family protein [uncultured Duncaniella sp.]|uniref:M24 family metallopeptidase n=1 Tax=uncultured Duncaniella sp. TaxID=2768039 RepID=UPI0026DEFFF3|nr:Xaa-Pro peptidase family protein [uncultured Duncaniella sp.]